MDIYQLALTHSSYSKDNPGEPNNERLEFYGDAVLKLVFSKYLYNRFLEEDEGVLTKYRSRLISDALLAEVGFELSFDKKLIVGSSLQNKPKPKSVVGDAVEAYIGALYIDKGYEAAEDFIINTWQEFIDRAIQESDEINFKAKLQDIFQKKYGEHPDYQTLDCIGPDHDKEFVIGVYFREELLAKGKGNSKKAASQDAARHALENIDK